MIKAHFLKGHDFLGFNIIKKVEKRHIRKPSPPRCNQNELSNIQNNNRVNPSKVGVRRSFSHTLRRPSTTPLHLQLETKILLFLLCRLFGHADKYSMPIQARSVILLFQVPLLTFQRLGLGPNSDLGLNKSTDQAKIELFFMAALHKFFLQFV